MDFGLECDALLITQIEKPERLLVPLLRAHRKQCRCTASDGVRPHVQGQLNRDSFIQTGSHFQQTSGDGDAQRFGPELAAVLELNGRGDGSPQVDPRCADVSSRIGEGFHCYVITMSRDAGFAQITKALP